jgi:C-terminal processing protease CtpA/Prc
LSSAPAAGLAKGLAAFLLFAGIASAAPAPSPRQGSEDFDALCKTIDEGYAYFDGERPQWKRACEKWRPIALRAGTHDDFVAALEGLVSELHDDAVTLSERSAIPPRRLPWETDMYAVLRDNVPLIDSVRTFGDADIAGVRPGAVLLKIDDIPVDQVIRNKLGPGPQPRRAMSWALRHALAGPLTGSVTITVRDGSEINTLRVDRSHPQSRAIGRPVYARRMGDDRDIGYLRVRIGADDAKLPGQFDAALAPLMGTRGLIIDIRDHPGPGTAEVTRAILSRFATSETAWQLRELPEGPRVFDTVAPRGEPYKGKVIVLVDRWTAAEGEAVATGLAAVANARIVGTRMTGLRGRVREVKLPHSKIAVTFPAERLFLVSGERREAYVPEILVDTGAPQGGPADPILSQGLKLLEPCPGPSCRSGQGSPQPVRGSLRR